MPRILIVDDDRGICAALSEFFTLEGHQAVVASSGREALAVAADQGPDVVLLDNRMPGASGLDVLPSLLRLDPRLPVVMMTAYGTSQTSIDAMRLGAFDYLVKPLDLDGVKLVVQKALAARAADRELEPGSARRTEPALVGSTAKMQEVYKLLGALAARDIPALLIGERGTGKRLVARTIHDSSRRRQGPFAVVSCRYAPEESLREVLVGREAGGGEIVARGQLEAGGGGTVLLDHSDALDLSQQAEILRFLTEGRLQRVGGLTPIAADTRLLFATERELGDQVRRGLWSEELFDRLRVFSVRLPALRDRRDDLPELVDHLIGRCNQELGLEIRGADPATMELFHDYPWPGNVGELENVLRRACALTRGSVITPEDLGDSMDEGWFVGRGEAESALEAGVRRAWLQRMRRQPDDGDSTSYHDIVAIVESTLIREALAETSGNQVRAARLLGITRTTLRTKMERFKL